MSEKNATLLLYLREKLRELDFIECGPWSKSFAHFIFEFFGNMFDRFLSNLFENGKNCRNIISLASSEDFKTGFNFSVRHLQAKISGLEYGG